MKMIMMYVDVVNLEFEMFKQLVVAIYQMATPM